MHQVGFTQAYAAIKEERVVAVLRIIRHLPGRSPGQLVGLTLDEVFEGERAIQVAGVLERTFNLHGALFGANRGLLRTGAGHRVEAVAGRLFTDFGHLLGRTFGLSGGRGWGWRADRSLCGLSLGSRGGQRSIRCRARCRTAVASGVCKACSSTSKA